MNVSGPSSVASASLTAPTGAERELAQTVEAAVDLAMEVVTRPGASSIGAPPTSPSAAELAGQLAMITSPEALFYLAQSQMNQADQRDAATKAHAHTAKAKSEIRHQKHLLDKAIEAARKKSKRPRFLRKLINAIVSAVAAIATVMSGGALAGLAIAGMVLMFASEHLVKGLVKLGVLSSKAAGWLSLALRIAGSILTAAAGPQGVKDATTAIAKFVASGAEVSKYTELAVAAAEAAVDTHTAVWAKRETSTRLGARAAELRNDEAVAAMKEAVEKAIDDFQRFSRVSRRVMKLAELNGEARMAATQLLV